MSEAIEVILPLTTTEKDRLAIIEESIESARLTISVKFKEIGGMLIEVRDSKLYRLSYGTFENYVNDRWQIGRQRAYQLMDAFKVQENCLQVLDIPNEGVAREFSKLTDKQQLKVAKAVAMKTAKTHKPVTAKIVKEAAQTLNVPRGGLFAYAIKAQELASQNIEYPEKTQGSESAARIRQDSNSLTREQRDALMVQGLAIIDATYAAHKARWNSPPPPSPRTIVDAIKKGFEA